MIRESIGHALQLSGRVMETGIQACQTIGGFALDTTTQLVETARASGVPLPDIASRALPAQRQEEQRELERDTVLKLSSVYLKAANMAQRNLPYAVDPADAKRVLEGYCKEVKIAPVDVLDVYAGRVVDDTTET